MAAQRVVLSDDTLYDYIPLSNNIESTLGLHVEMHDEVLNVDIVINFVKSLENFKIRFSKISTKLTAYIMSELFIN